MLILDAKPIKSLTYDDEVAIRVVGGEIEALADEGIVLVMINVEKYQEIMRS